MVNISALGADDSRFESAAPDLRASYNGIT